MKKILTILAAMTLTLSASAQMNFSVIEQSMIFNPFKDRTHTVQLLDYVGIGLSMPLGDQEFVDHTSFGKNTEFFINMMTFKYNRTKGSTYSIGVDLNWDTYKPDTGWAYFGGDNNLYVEPIGSTKLKTNRFRVFSLQIPFDYTRAFGSGELTVGAAAELNFPGNTKVKGTDNSGYSWNESSKEIKTNTVTFNVHAQFAYHRIGLYLKYSPVPVLKEDFGPIFTSWTVGLILK